ncbi:hypothetical protein Tco_1508334 [Tanacetum coccineum]
MVFNSPCLTDKKELIHHEVEMVINSPWIMPLLGTKGLASPEQTATDDLCAEFSSIQVKTQADWMLLQSSYFNSQVPTGRVVVPTGRYVVPAGKVIIIVSLGRLSLVPTSREYLVPGELTLSLLDVLQGFSFFLQMGFTLILATLDGLDVGLLGDVIGEDDCDDDG